MQPPRPPIGLTLIRIAQHVSRAFDDALVAAGGSRTHWLILGALRSRTLTRQGELADAVGITAPTLSHHLNDLEADGLLVRRSVPADRRVHQVELTARGEQALDRMSAAAHALDDRLRDSFSDTDVAALTHLLTLLHRHLTD